MPLLEQKPINKNKRSKTGDFLAALLLLAILLGMGRLWWQQKHPKKSSQDKKPAVVAVKKSPVAVTSKPIEQKPLEKTKPDAPVVVPPPTSKLSVTTTNSFPRPVRDLLEAQVALARIAISPGSIDGAIGSQTRAAIAAFQRLENLSVSSALDTNTRAALLIDAPVMVAYTVTTNDLARLQPIGKTWLEKSQQSALEYETILELVAEKAHAHPAFIQRLNPGVNWTNISAGTSLKMVDVEYPEPEGKAAFVVIHLSAKFLEAFDAETNLLLHCPVSIAARVEKRPVGELRVSALAPDPNYTFDPAVFPESPEAQALGRKLILPPGPNNPVGVAWVSLDKPGYGIHGTPIPEQVGRTESHGCFRLANWDAAYFIKLAWVGLPITVVP